MAKKDKNSKLTTSEKFSEKTNIWIGNHSKFLIGIGAAVIVVLLACIIIFAVINNTSEKKFEALSALETSYINIAEIGDEQFIKEAEALIADAGLDTYPGTKAALMIADVAYGNEDYTTALDWYTKVAEVQEKTYLYQVAVISAAACDEMLGNASAALDKYNQLWSDFGRDGLYGSRALFNAARLYESQGNIELAKATYDQLVGEYEEMQSEYASLATTRLAQLDLIK